MKRMQMLPAASVPWFLLVCFGALIFLLRHSAPLVTEASLASVAPWIHGNPLLTGAILLLGMLPALYSTTVLALASVFYASALYTAGEEKESALRVHSTEPVQLASEAAAEPTQGLLALANALGHSSTQPSTKAVEPAAEPQSARSF